MSQSLYMTRTVVLWNQFWIKTKGTNSESDLCYLYSPISFILGFSHYVRGGRFYYRFTFKIKQGIYEDKNLLPTASNRVELEAPYIQSRLETSNLIASIQCRTNFSRRIVIALTVNFLPEGTNPNFCITKKEWAYQQLSPRIKYKIMINKSLSPTCVPTIYVEIREQIYEPFWDTVQKVM